MIPLGYDQKPTTTFDMQQRARGPNDEPYKYSHRLLVADLNGMGSGAQDKQSDCLNQFLDTYNLEGATTVLTPTMANADNYLSERQMLNE